MHIHTSSKKHQKSPFFGPLKIPPKIPPFCDPPRTPQNRKTPRLQISPNFTQFCTKCAHLYTPNFTNSPLFTDPESPRTPWIHPASKPLIRDALEYTPKYRGAHSGRTVYTRVHTCTPEIPPGTAP